MIVQLMPKRPLLRWDDVKPSIIWPIMAVVAFPLLMVLSLIEQVIERWPG